MELFSEWWETVMVSYYVVLVLLEIIFKAHKEEIGNAFSKIGILKIYIVSFSCISLISITSLPCVMSMRLMSDSPGYLRKPWISLLALVDFYIHFVKTSMLSISLQRECKWTPRNDCTASSDFSVPKYRFSVLRNKWNIHRESK